MSLLRLPVLLRPHLLRPPHIRTAIPIHRFQQFQQFHATPRPQSQPLVEARFSGLTHVPHDLFISLHDLGYSWAVVIPLAAVSVRLIMTLLIALPQRRLMQRKFQLHPLLSARHAVTQRLLYDNLKSGKLPMNGLKTRIAELEEFLKGERQKWTRYWVGSMIPGLQWLQLPVFLGMVETMRSMMGMKGGFGSYVMRRLGLSGGNDTVDVGLVDLEPKKWDENLYNPDWFEPTMAIEGLPWALDLTVMDPTLTMPFVVSGLMMANLYQSARPMPGAAVSPFKRRLTRGLALCFLLIGPLTLHLPIGILYYWACSSATNLASNVLLDYIYPLRGLPKKCKRPLVE